MAFIHGSHTVIKLGTADISEYTKSSELGREAEAHDVTGYHPTRKSKVYAPGLLDAKFKAEGVYDSTATTGPRAVILPLVGTEVELIRQPEGTGANLPQDKVKVIITGYTETNPYDGMVGWSVEGQCSGDIDSTAQAGA